MFGLYIHIPFCDGKCYYCNFFSKHMTEAQMDEYTDQMIRSISLWSKRLDKTIDTVYFGGGTPSLLGHKRLIRILDAAKTAFTITENAEITVEEKPPSTSEFRLDSIKATVMN